MTRYLFLLLSFWFISSGAYSQAGAKLYAGVITTYNKDKVITPKGTLHSGWITGIDARLNSGRMYYLMGGQYGKADLLGTTKPRFFVARQQMTFLKGRVGLGFDMIRISPRFFITSKIVGSINYIVAYPEELLTIEGYKTLNDGTAGLIGGLGVKIGILNIDLEYEHGLFNIIPDKPDSNMNYISLTGGINF